MAKPDFLPGTSLIFVIYIEMNNALTFRPTIPEITLLLVGTILFLITVLVILLLT